MKCVSRHGNGGKAFFSENNLGFQEMLSLGAINGLKALYGDQGAIALEDEYIKLFKIGERASPQI